ncbi:GNAT family N-acetyltransferase [Candidatus Roizmanbacteria bacterium]|nr:GNAT family N-acetyltransferase [Candidatus Roizmanbacteria bacterium]
MNEFVIQYREKNDNDDDWIKKVATEQWGSDEIISKDHLYKVEALPGFIAEQNNKPIGVILYAIEEKECEIVALYSSFEKQGIGSRLIELVCEIAKITKCQRVWLQTTNDNTTALRFYQKRGFVIAAIRTNVIEAQRKVKEIPFFGNDGIPIRDEIELELIIKLE